MVANGSLQGDLHRMIEGQLPHARPQPDWAMKVAIKTALTLALSQRGRGNVQSYDIHRALIQFPQM